MRCPRCGHDQFDVLLQEEAGGKTLFEFSSEALKAYPTVQEWCLDMLGLKVSDMFKTLETAGSATIWKHVTHIDYKGDNSEYRFKCLGCGQGISEQEITTLLVARMREFYEEQV
jgi:hypothetical protein